MPTNVIEVGPARTYGNAWQTAGTAINEGLGTVLGYYQEYQRQKRFEQQQKQEHELKLQEMNDRAEQRRQQRQNWEDQQNAKRAQAATQRAVLMGANPDPTALPEDWVETTTIKGQELAGPMPDGVSPLMGRDQTVKTPKKFVEYGDYVAPLDFGGVNASKQKQRERVETGMAVPATPQLTATLDKLGLGHFEDVVPAAIMGIYQQHLRDQQADEALASREKIANDRLAAAVAKGSGSGEGGVFKTFWDTRLKKDVLATDKMVAAAPPGTYEPAHKGEDEGKPLAVGEINQVRDFVSGLGTLSNLLDEAQGSGTIPWAQTKTPNIVTEWFGWGQDAKSRQASLDAAKQVIGKAMEGGVLRKEDEAKYMKILPIIKDPPKLARSKILNLVRTMKRDAENYMRILEAGGRNVGDVRKIVEEAGENAAGTVGLSGSDPFGVKGAK